MARTYGSTSTGSSECLQSRYDLHSFVRLGDNTALGFHDGPRWLSNTFTLAPGESSTFLIEMNLQKDNMSKDWALTAWGENGPLTVSVQGKTSDTWSEIIRDDSLLPSDEFEIPASDSPTTGQTDAELAEFYAAAAEA